MTTPADAGIMAARRDALADLSDTERETRVLEDAWNITADPKSYGWSAHLDPDQHHDLHAAIAWIVGVFEEQGIGARGDEEQSAAAEGALRRALEYLRPEG